MNILRIFFITALLVSTPFLLTACEQESALEKAAGDVTDAYEGAKDDFEDAGDDLEEAGDEVSDEIDDATSQ